MSLVNKFFNREIDHFVNGYLDDIFGSKTLEEHPGKLKFVLERLRYEIIYGRL